MRAFWLLSNTITRLHADDDRRALWIAASAGSEQGVQTLGESIIQQLGDEPIKASPRITARRDEDGFNELKRMSMGA